MTCFNIMAVAVNYRTKNAVEVQNVLTKHGCIISVRLGLHETDNVCADSGLIILQLTGKHEEISSFQNDLSMIEGVSAKTIEICS